MEVAKLFSVCNIAGIKLDKGIINYRGLPLDVKVFDILRHLMASSILESTFIRDVELMYSTINS
jgi:hypothetical protein